jgi:hypothetical protein
MTRVRVYTKNGQGILAEFRFANGISDEGLEVIAHYARRHGCGAYYLEAFPTWCEKHYP